MRWFSLERLPLLDRQRPLAYGAAAVLTAAAWWIRLTLDALFPPGFPYLTFFPAVVLSAFLFGRGPGLLAAVTGGLLAWYFFIPPERSLAFNGRIAVALGFYAGAIGVDLALIDWMQRAARRLGHERERNERLAQERGEAVDRAELLFGELQHRVSNNLQMVGAVLNLQRRQLDDAAARQALAEAATKLQLIGRIQRQLYDPRGRQVALDRFLAELVADLVEAAARPGVTWAVEAEADLALPPGAAIPLALVMAEAIANAVEHGFAGRERGRVEVVVGRLAERIELVVRDDGRGLPLGFDATAVTSLGLRVARALARQLGADFRLENAVRGTELRLTLPPTAG